MRTFCGKPSLGANLPVSGPADRGHVLGYPCSFHACSSSVWLLRTLTVLFRSWTRARSYRPAVMAQADKNPDGKDMCFLEKWIVGCPPPFSFLFVFVFQLRQVRWEESCGCSTPAFRIPGWYLLHWLFPDPKGIPSSRLNVSQRTVGVVLWGKVSLLSFS